MKIILFALVFLIANLSQAIAQDEQALKQYFEGDTITLKIDMPATFEGVNIYPNDPNHLDDKKYTEKLNQHGISIRKGERAQITKVLQKEQHIEFQLSGGGYSPRAEKEGDAYRSILDETDEEKTLKEKINKESDIKEKVKLRRELRKLQKSRRVAQEKINMNAEKSQAAQREETKRIPREIGSRFNIRYTSKVGPDQLTTESIKAALSEYVDFEDSK